MNPHVSFPSAIILSLMLQDDLPGPRKRTPPQRLIQQEDGENLPANKRSKGSKKESSTKAMAASESSLNKAATVNAQPCGGAVGTKSTKRANENLVLKEVKRRKRRKRVFCLLPTRPDCYRGTHSCAAPTVHLT